MADRIDYTSPLNFFLVPANIYLLNMLISIQILLIVFYIMNSVVFSYKSIYWRRIQQTRTNLLPSHHSIGYRKGREYTRYKNGPNRLGDISEIEASPNDLNDEYFFRHSSLSSSSTEDENLLERGKVDTSQVIITH